MTRNYIIIFTALIMALSISSCNGGNGNVSSVEKGKDTQRQVVAALRRPEAVNTNMLVSKGVIKSDNEVAVFSRITGQLNEVKLIDGQKVKKGDVLFTLDPDELRMQVELAEAQLEQAYLKTEEIVIGLGYQKGQMNKVPQALLRAAKIKSGYNVAEKELALARKKLENSIIKAPLSGVIANVSSTKSYSYVNPGQTLCKIVDTGKLIVEFSILESELDRFAVGKEILINSLAYSDEYHSAEVRSIGSIVNEAGMVIVEAEISDNRHLMPGMTAIIKL
ncbi:MAG: efflux RND transporter periplasmic adaptor subunit [Bacteroidales bacterium]|nr:efflux RND transporter periplasmic adaptor subunit [Candidatus Egerieousia equi]